LSNIPLYIHNLVFSLSIHWLLGHHSWFQSLGTIKKTAISMDTQVSPVYWFTILWICTRVVWWGHMLSLLAVFWGTSILISIVVALVYIPTKSFMRVPYSRHPL
jgi:hypothetical protein